MITLKVQKRDAGGSLAQLRTTGSVPAVFYGPQEESTPISFNQKDFTKIWNEVGSSTIITIKGKDINEKEALIQEVVVQPVSGEVLHADLYTIERGKKLSVSVPLEFIGEAPAEKVGGIVVKVLHEINMKVRPSDIPQHIEVDLTELLDLSSTITVGDLKLPESAEITLGAGEAVASITEAKEEPQEPEEERDIEDVEVEEKGKKPDSAETSEDKEEEGAKEKSAE